MVRRERTGNGQNLGRYWKVALAGVGVIGGAIAYASLVEPRTILLREHDLEIPTLPPSLNGLRIAFLSDFHLGGPGDPLGATNRALNVLHEQQPDLILLGGDYYDHGMRVVHEPEWSVFPAIAPTFAVPGNHDYRTDRVSSEEIMRALSEAGITVLRNETIDVELPGGVIRLIGLDDPYTAAANYEEAIRTVSSDIHPTIMLTHAGLIADSLPEASADLILTGHTHGAQIRFSPFRHTSPMDIFWWLDYLKDTPLSPYRQGLFRVRGSLLYVGNGLGTTSLGMRFLAAPEVAIFRLFHGTGDPARSCDDPHRPLISYTGTRLAPLPE